MIPPNNAIRIAKNEDLDQTASLGGCDLGLHCLIKPVCSKYRIIAVSRAVSRAMESKFLDFHSL